MTGETAERSVLEYPALNQFLGELVLMPIEERVRWVDAFNSLTGEQAIALARKRLDAEATEPQQEAAPPRRMRANPTACEIPGCDFGERCDSPHKLEHDWIESCDDDPQCTRCVPLEPAEAAPRVGDTLQEAIDFFADLGDDRPEKKRALVLIEEINRIGGIPHA